MADQIEHGNNLAAHLPEVFAYSLVEACLSAGRFVSKKKLRNTRRSRGTALADLEPPPKGVELGLDCK